MIGTRPGGSGVRPVGARLRAGHHLVERPVVCYVAGAGRPVELVNGYKAALVGSGHGITHTRWGPALDFTTTAAEWDAPFDQGSASATQAIHFPSTSCTVALLRRCADTTNRTGAAFGIRSNTGTRRMSAKLPDSTSGFARWDFGGSTGSNRLSVSYTKTTNDEAWVFVAGTRGMAMYCNGVRLGGTSTAVTRSAVAIEQLRLNGGDFAADGTGDVQAIALVLMVEQEWTPTQAMEWMAAPFSVFEQPAVRRWVPVPAAAGTNNGAALYHHFRNLGVY